MAGRILESVREDLDDRDGVSGWNLDRVTVGDRAVLVELAARSDSQTRVAGVAHRPRGSASDVTTETVTGLLEPIDGSDLSVDDGRPNAGDRLPLAAAVGTLNALSAPFLGWQSGDPMALLSPSVRRITTVGLFKPALRKFEDCEVRVIEREPRTVDPPEGVSVRMFSPERAERAMDGAEIVFITGSTLLYGGLERYLDLAPTEATVVIVGATVSFIPDPLFDSGVDVVAGASVSDPTRARNAIVDGACGTDLHTNGVEKRYTTAGGAGGTLRGS